MCYSFCEASDGPVDEFCEVGCWKTNDFSCCVCDGCELFRLVTEIVRIKHVEQCRRRTRRRRVE